MLNAIADIKAIWPGDALNIDDTVKDGNDKTAFDRFIEKAGAAIDRRLKKWVGEAVFEDASSATPTDSDRADAIKEAEMELFHASMAEHMMRENIKGMEKDITLPSGMRISLSVFSREDYEKTILLFSDAAYCRLVEWIL
ncbi:MAG: hypothetical protein EPN93_17455 [Spirochaetes bacterium]|nr:MAG: hypothetical protein EPN93_17455 [Spirochaetota bacterium]